MGYCMLGLAALTKYGMTGSILQMFNHGTSTSMMFLLVGVIYDRAHHRDVNKLDRKSTRLNSSHSSISYAVFCLKKKKNKKKIQKKKKKKKHKIYKKIKYVNIYS